MVDDEPLIRQSLVHKLKKSPFPIALLEQASGGGEALRLIEGTPFDIVLCDIRMSDMNGLSLCAALQKALPDIKIIIISGYNQFDYAKKALQIRAVDFLLKPVDAYELYHSVSKCIALLGSERRYDALRETGLLLRIAEERYARLLACMEADEDPAPLLFPEDGMGGSYLCCCVFFPHGDEPGCPQDGMFTELLAALREGGAGPGRERGVSVAKSWDGYLILFGLPEESSRRKWESEARRLLNALDERLSRLGTYAYTMGISESCAQLGEAVRQAVSAMEHRVLLENSSRVFWSEIKHRTEPYQLSAQFQNQLRYAARVKDYGVVEQVFKRIYEDTAPLAMSYSSCSNLHTLLQLIADEELPALKPSALLDKKPYHYHSLGELLDSCKNRFMEAISLTAADSKSSKKKLVAITREYIDRSYAEPVTLERAAELLHISPGYLSALFKEVMGVNFQEYLISVRVENAKQLLTDGYTSINEVAAMSGFNDQHYFSRVFKRVTSVTPRMYRDLYPKR